MHLYRAVIACLALVFATQAISQSSPASTRTQPYKTVDFDLSEKQCEARRGMWWRSGGPIRPNEKYFCYLPSPDAGKNCSSSKECLAGACLTRKDSPGGEKQGTRIVGACTEYALGGGCVARVEAGRVQPMICSD